MLEVTERINLLADEHFWEIKVQCLEFAVTMLTQNMTLSHLLAQKDELKAKIGGDAQKNSPTTGGGAAGSGLGKPGSNAPGGADRNQVKIAMQQSVNIIKKVFNVNAPRCVQKLGLFKIQPLLKEFKILYNSYIEVLTTIDQEIKSIILSEEPIRTGEEIYFSLGSISFNYKLKSDLSNFDMI